MRDINKTDSEGNFVLSPLRFTDDYLEPYIGERTVRFHYWKHLKSYIDKVNSLKSYETSIEEILHLNNFCGNDLYKNASQVYNHYFYFEQLNAKGVKDPLPKMKGLIEEKYGSWECLRSSLSEEAMRVFGSGWVFLVLNFGRLNIVSYSGTGTPTGITHALMSIDVWEHAYYLDYQNDRKRYLDNFFGALDWTVIENRLLNV